MIPLLLTPEIKRHIFAKAQARQQHKIASTSRKKDRAWSDLAVHYLGLKGEYVVKTAHGIPFDDEAYGAHGDSGIDVRISGLDCAIKARHLRTGDHVVEFPKDLEHVSHVLFVRGECRKDLCLCRSCDVEWAETWTFCGWLTVEEFWQRATKDDWGYGPRWWVHQGQIHDTLLSRQMVRL